MKRLYVKCKLIAVTVLIMFLSNCTATTTQLSAPAVTPGMAKKKIEKGVTSQEEIFKLFGAPNFMTSTAEGGELWVYSNFAHVNQAIELGLLGGGAGSSGGALLGVGGSYGASSSRSITLMIKFDESDKVIDYNVNQLQY